MRLDTLRILGLIICTRQSEILIQLGTTPELVAELQSNYVSLALVFQSLSLDDKHRNMYLHHVEYQIAHASITLEQFGDITLVNNVLDYMRSALLQGGVFQKEGEITN